MNLDIETLYRRYGDMVLGRCMTLLRNEATAQEACQEVFLRLTQRRWQFRGAAAPSTYLYRITTNHCLNLLRAKRRSREDAVEDIQALADTVVDRVELRDLLQRVMDDADARTRECVVYSCVDGMTNTEIGALLGISEAAVRKRLKRFRKQAQHHLAASQ